jgi:hypothetical protein
MIERWRGMDKERNGKTACVDYSVKYRGGERRREG